MDKTVSYAQPVAFDGAIGLRKCVCSYVLYWAREGGKAENGERVYMKKAR